MRVCTCVCSQVRTILSTAVVVSSVLVREELPVVVHATTGFDQTAQVIALAQLMMDPYFRTYTG